MRWRSRIGVWCLNHNFRVQTALAAFCVVCKNYNCMAQPGPCRGQVAMQAASGIRGLWCGLVGEKNWCLVLESSFENKNGLACCVVCKDQNCIAQPGPSGGQVVLQAASGIERCWWVA